MEDETWKDVLGYEGKYQVSNLGNVLSLNYNNTGKPKLLKPKINRYGYNEIKLSKNNKTKNFLVATLVAQAFLKTRSPDKEVMHIDNNSNDNVNNLRYAYRSEILHSMYKKGHRKTGEPSQNIISYKGKKYKKFSGLAKNFNLTLKQFYHRIERGWTLNEALEIPYNRKEKILHKKLYNYEGKLMSVKHLAKISGISEKRIYERLNRGWSVEETVEIPLKGGKSE